MKTTLTDALTLLGCTWLLLSCAKEKEGVIDSPQNPPRLLSASIQPAVIDLDSDTTCVAEPSGGGNLDCRGITLTARAVDSDGLPDIPFISFAINGPNSTSPYAAGTLQQTVPQNDTAQYSGTISLTLRRSDAGQHFVEFQVSDNSGHLSNAVRIPLSVVRNNSRPQVSELSAPDTLRIPTSGVRLFSMAISAVDSDGIADIAEVYFKSINSSNPNAKIFLFDDGNIPAYGDTLAGDGRFSRILQIDSSATPGVREFRFWGEDRLGALSDSIIHFITVIPE